MFNGDDGITSQGSASGHRARHNYTEPGSESLAERPQEEEPNVTGLARRVTGSEHRFGWLGQESYGHRRENAFHLIRLGGLAGFTERKR